MQIIPAASGSNGPSAGEYVQAMGAAGLPSTGASFQSVMAASVQNARTGQSPGRDGGQMADGGLGDGGGLMSLRLLSALRRKAGEGEDEADMTEADYLLAGMLAPPADTHISQTDGSAEDHDAVAHILQGDRFQTPVGPMADTPADGPQQGVDADNTREMLARMPQTQPQEQAASAATDGGSCPLENVNDLMASGVKHELNQLAARVREANAQAAEALAAEGGDAPDAPRIQPRAETPEAHTGAGGQEDKTGQEAGSDLAGMSRPLDIGALRAQGELQNAQPAPQAATATTETLLDTMVEKLSLERQGDSHQMEIQLRPEHLGKVTIQLTLDGNGVQAKIRTEDPGVRGLIGSQVNQLIEALEQKGVRLTAVDVTYQAPQQDMSQQSGGREQMSQESRNRGLSAQAISRGESREDEDPYAALSVDTYVSQSESGAAYSL